jgi:hypothetical protein
MSSSKVPTVIFACPTYGPIHRRVYESHLAAVGGLAKEGIIVTPKSVVVTGKMGLASASNEIVRAALALKPDYVFWTEMDMVLNGDTIRTLLKHAIQYDLDVLAGIYPLRGSGQPCLYRRNNIKGHSRFAHTPLTNFPENAIFPLEGCPGVGCVLFKTSVFEKVAEPWWDDQEGKCGQDIYFYTMLNEAGVKVWVDSSVIVQQIDDDEPRLWTREDMHKWQIENLPRGFIQDMTGAISLGENNVKA